MQNLQKNHLIAIGGGIFASGLMIGWAITADYYDHKMKGNQRLLGDIIERKTAQIEYLNHVRDYQLSPHEVVETEAEIVDAKLDEIEAENDEALEGYSEEKTEEIRGNLQKLIDKYTNDEDNVEHFVHSATRTMEARHAPPFVISREKFAWDEMEGDDYDKLTLTYYPRERILLDDGNELVEDIDATVGWKSLSRFGDESGDPDVVFVRNRKMMTDFEVVRETENQPPAHIRYGMSQDEFETNKAAGLIRFRPGDV